MHYQRWLHHGSTDLLTEWANPLVCECSTPAAHPRRNFGMCQTCKRKPVALMAVG